LKNGRQGFCRQRCANSQTDLGGARSQSKKAFS
jgi:hypothetical protein